MTRPDECTRRYKAWQAARRRLHQVTRPGSHATADEIAEARTALQRARDAIRAASRRPERDSRRVRGIE